MKKLIKFIILFGVYKPKIKIFFAIVYQRWPSFNKVLRHQKFQKYCILNMYVQETEVIKC